MKAIGYIRVSGQSQVEGDGPERQARAIEAFCKQHGLEIGRNFVELAVSGTVDGLDRPEFLNCIRTAEQYGAAIVVERLDRLARDLMVQELMMRECRERGVKVFAVDQGQPIDIASNDGDPTRKLMRQIMGALAEWEKSALVLKLRRARDRVRAEKGHCEGPMPYGYAPGEAGIVARMRAMRRCKYKIEDIINTLNVEGVKTRLGKQWTKWSVLSALKKGPKE